MSYIENNTSNQAPVTHNSRRDDAQAAKLQQIRDMTVMSLMGEIVGFINDLESKLRNLNQENSRDARRLQLEQALEVFDRSIAAAGDELKASLTHGGAQLMGAAAAGAISGVAIGANVRGLESLGSAVNTGKTGVGSMAAAGYTMSQKEKEAAIAYLKTAMDMCQGIAQDAHAAADKASDSLYQKVSEIYNKASALLTALQGALG